ncbi:phosphate-starvation-inducible protein PsiE [Niallia sp. 03133]|uniref:phosphate-starvation-inducible protein PsiE n=1 Tax=Niallia sp. 03133 TaxID=3458060 RepID=UPI0040447EB1
MESRKAEKKPPKKPIKLSFILQLILNISLVLLAITLSILMSKEMVYFIHSSIFLQEHANYEVLMERILVFFLYFEFIALIVKYFQENYHFPLRYFLYIGITAMVRLIIVYHDNPVNTLLYSCAILVLVISYYIISSRSKKEKL